MSSMRNAFEKAIAIKSEQDPEAPQNAATDAELATLLLNGPAAGQHVFVYEASLPISNSKDAFVTQINVDGKLGFKVKNERFLRTLIAHHIVGILDSGANPDLSSRMAEVAPHFSRYEIKRFLAGALSYRLISSHPKR